MLEIALNLEGQNFLPADKEIIDNIVSNRATAATLFDEGRNMDALERTLAALRQLREFSDYDNPEFRALLIGLLFDLAEIHFVLKDYKQSEKETETIFKVLANQIKEDPDRFGPLHILAMELSTRIMRSRKKAMELLVKHQLNAGVLYDKVSSGISAATDKLVDSLKNVGQLLASTGDYRGAMKFYAEAIKISKKRSGRVTRKEIKMTIEMAEIMMRIPKMLPRARRLLTAILPHAIAMETIELEEDILALTEMIDSRAEGESRWKLFMHKITSVAKGISRKNKEDKGDSENPEGKPDEKEEAEKETVKKDSGEEKRGKEEAE